MTGSESSHLERKLPHELQLPVRPGAWWSSRFLIPSPLHTVQIQGHLVAAPKLQSPNSLGAGAVKLHAHLAFVASQSKVWLGDEEGYALTDRAERPSDRDFAAYFSSPLVGEFWAQLCDWRRCLGREQLLQVSICSCHRGGRDVVLQWKGSTARSSLMRVREGEVHRPSDECRGF